MTNQEIMKIALQQSASDCNCAPDDFLKKENVITRSIQNKKARKCLPLPFECDMVSYGNNIVAQTSERLENAVKKYINKYDVAHAFETPHIYALNEELSQFGMKVCFMAEYYLPDLDRLKPLPCNYEMRVLHQKDFENLYTGEWINALCKKRKHLDVLGIGAYDGNKLVGLAACSADCDDMYQIGVDVLPEYRKQGIATAITSNLATEILKLGKVPYYCTAWCNIKSVRNAIKCGFVPAWVEITARNIDFINKIDNN